MITLYNIGDCCEEYGTITDIDINSNEIFYRFSKGYYLSEKILLKENIDMKVEYERD